MKIKNLFLDFFYENIPVPTLDIISGLCYAIVITGNEENIYLRNFMININKNEAKNQIDMVYYFFKYNRIKLMRPQLMV